MNWAEKRGDIDLMIIFGSRAKGRDRPDMALQKFAQAITKGETIQVFNHGNHRRDFTYIDDIVEGVIRVLDRPALLQYLRPSPRPRWCLRRRHPQVDCCHDQKRAGLHQW